MTTITNASGKEYKIPSATELKRAAAHARRLESKFPEYSGLHIDVYYDLESGEFRFHELSQNSFIDTHEHPEMFYLAHKDFSDPTGRLSLTEDEYAAAMHEWIANYIQTL